MTLIHWTRQIKEVLSVGAQLTLEGSLPLDEIEFWRKMCGNLAGVASQLGTQEVRRVLEILEVRGEAAEGRCSWRVVTAV
jgi:hypothetical protein